MAFMSGFNLGDEVFEKFPVVAISHEFSTLFPDKKSFRLEQFKKSDLVVFTTEGEYDSAKESMLAEHGEQAATDLKNKSFVYPVPPTIPLSDNAEIPAFKDRSKDILVFGLIKLYKNLESLPDIARKMSQDDYFKGRSMVIAGNILTNNPDHIGVLTNVLLPETYPALKEANLNQLSREQIAELVNILQDQTYNSKPSFDDPKLNSVITKIKRNPAMKALPINIKLSLSDDEVSDLMLEHKYRFLPIDRGATPHSSTLASAMDHRMIVFAKDNPETPASLKNGSIVLMDKAEDILKNIKSHEAKVQDDPNHEENMIKLGKTYRDQRSWHNLAKMICTNLDNVFRIKTK
jgi:hypothetical protein